MRKNLFSLKAAVLSLMAAFALTACDESEKTGPEVPPETQSPFSFELVDRTSGSITVKVTPEDETMNYYWCQIPQTVLEERYGMEPARAAQDVITLMQNNYADYGCTSFEELYQRQISVGEETDTFDGYDAETGIRCLAFGFDISGKMTTEVVLSDLFVTDSVEPSSNTFTISRVDDSAVLVAEPTNDDQYCFYVLPKSVVGGYETPAAFAESFVETYHDFLDGYIAVTGRRELDATLIFLEFGPGMYTAFAFGYESGVVTTDVELFDFEYVEEIIDPSIGEPFSTLAADVSLECTNAYLERSEDQMSEEAAEYFLALQAEGSYGVETRLGIYFFVDPSKPLLEAIAGSFRVSGSLAAGTVLMGWMGADEWHYGSVYYEMDAYFPAASLDSGNMTIESAGGGVYNITVEAEDMNGHAIRATYSGGLDLTEL